MSISRTADKRLAACRVCILTQLPLRLQHEIAVFKVAAKPKILYLKTATIRITESVSGELVIEIDPP